MTRIGNVRMGNMILMLWSADGVEQRIMPAVEMSDDDDERTSADK